jgi:lipopolysaccharide/colanic/teichoic acid biosynthesis glycosyltransferase
MVRKADDDLIGTCPHSEIAGDETCVGEENSGPMAGGTVDGCLAYRRRCLAIVRARDATRVAANYLPPLAGESPMGGASSWRLLVPRARGSHFEQMIKLLFDNVIAWVAWVVLSPVVFSIAVLVKLDSFGPVFYRGVRSGRYSKPFRIYKFRTMVFNAESIGGGTTALNDPRITRVGRLLRHVKLDELPQLLNIIAGDMSFVGPRPELPYYTQQYTGEEKIILSVKPGITDFSSVTFSSLDQHVGSQNADQVFEKEVLPIKNQLRVKYVKECSFTVDLAIIGHTVRKILKKFRTI